MEYIQHITFWGDVKIVFDTVKQVFFHQKGLPGEAQDEVEITDDYGDYLLKRGAVSREEYEEKAGNGTSTARWAGTHIGLVEVMEMDELVSIIMPSYNTANYIAASIQSVLDQTYQNWELLLVDDCSTDDTDAVVAPFLSDARIRYLKNDRNSGAAISRNRALREAKGRWIAFLDSDDLWYPTKLEAQLKFMQSHGYHFSYTNYEELNEAGAQTGVHVSGPKRITKPACTISAGRAA